MGKINNERNESYGELVLTVEGRDLLIVIEPPGFQDDFITLSNIRHPVFRRLRCKCQCKCGCDTILSDYTPFNICHACNDKEGKGGHSKGRELKPLRNNGDDNILIRVTTGLL